MGGERKASALTTICGSLAAAISNDINFRLIRASIFYP